MKTRPRTVAPTTSTLLALVASPLLAGGQAEDAGGVPGPGKPEDYVVVTVDGGDIMMSDVAARFRQMTGRPLGSLDDAQLQRFMSQDANRITNDLISERLLSAEAARREIEVAPAEVDAAVGQVFASVPQGMTKEQYLVAMGTTEDGVRENVVRTLRIQQFVENETAHLEPPTEAEVRSFYDSRPEEFQSGETVRARHILLSTQDLTDPAEIAEKEEAIKAIRERLVGDSAEDFATVATETSEGPSAPDGGDLGEFTRGQMVPEFDQAAFALEPGAVSQPVKTQFGYHLIKVESRTEARTVPFDEAKAEVAQFLEFQKRGEAVQALVAKLREGAAITTPER